MEERVQFAGRTVRLLPNDSPELKVGSATMIYHDPVTRQRPEGVAVIGYIDRRRSSPEFIEARVEFVKEIGPAYSRRIYRLA